MAQQSWFQNLKQVAGNIRLMLPLLWRIDKWLLLLVALITALRSGAPAVSLLLSARLVDRLASLLQGNQADWQPLLWLVALQALLELFTTAAGYLQELLTLKQTQKVEHYMQLRLMDKATGVPLADYARPGFYDKVQQARNGLSFRGVRWLEQTAGLLRQGTSLVSLLVIIARVHVGLAIAMAALIIPAVWVQMHFGSLRFFQMRYQTPTSRQMSYAGELLTGTQAAAEVRLFGMAGYLKAKWDRLFWQNAREVYGLRRQSTGLNFAVDLGSLAVGTGAVLFLLYYRQRSALSVGTYLLVFQGLQSVRGLAQGLAGSLSQLFEDALFVTDLFEFLARPDEHMATAGALPCPAPLRQGIAVENLSFRYPESRRPTLHNVTFELLPGERVAIVGENGSGKSTLVKCLLGLYQPDHGAVRFDGVDIRQMDPASLRGNVTAIFQDFVPYQFTVRENVTIGDLSRADDEERLAEALRRSGAGEVIRDLPDGADTPIGSLFSGINLSRGQWQKLAMARAFFRESQLVILDEPTASLDPQTEALVFEQFAALAAGKTALLISHRLGMCHAADRILVLKQGELVEQGTHAQLMALDGEYARMYRTQASWYDGSAMGLKGEQPHEQYASL